MLSLIRRIRISSNSRRTRIFQFRELQIPRLCCSACEQSANCSNSRITYPVFVFTLGEICRFPTADNRKGVCYAQKSGGFTKFWPTAGMACHSQLWKCPGPTFGGLTLGRQVSSFGGSSVSFYGNGFISLGTSLGGKQFCSLSRSEMQPDPSLAEEIVESQASRKTVYDTLETDKITSELFPELDFGLDGNFYPRLVALVAKKINTFLEEDGGMKKITKLLELLGLKLTPHIAGEVLKLQKDTAKANYFFEWAGNQPDFQHNAHTYNIKLWYLVSLKNYTPGDLVRALFVLEEMLAKNISADPLAYNILINRLCKDNKVGAALKIMTQLGQREGFPDLVTYNSVINGLAKLGLFSEVFELIDKMKQNGLTPQKITYNSIIHGLGFAGRWKEACNMFNELPAKGITPDVVTYNSLIAGLFRCRQVEEAYKIYGLMGLRGCEPDRITYNILIDGLSKANRLSEAWKIFHYMSEKGCRSDVVTYNTLISALITDGKQAEALKLLIEMRRKGCKPSNVTYRLLGGIDPEKLSDLLSQVENPGDVIAGSDESSKGETESSSPGLEVPNEVAMEDEAHARNK